MAKKPSRVYPPCPHGNYHQTCREKVYEGHGNISARRIGTDIDTGKRFRYCGYNICIHGNQTDKCKEKIYDGTAVYCGTNICEHGRRKRQCEDIKEDGSHCPGKRRTKANGYFKVFIPAENMPLSRIVTNPSHFCKCSKRLSPKRIPSNGGSGMCAECDEKRPRRRELVLQPQILERMNPREPEITGRTMLGGKSCQDVNGRRFPDLLFRSIVDNDGDSNETASLVNVCVSIEIDEDSHVDRLSQCEAGKVWDEFVAIKNLTGTSQTYFFVLRFNPDAYDGRFIYVKDRMDAVTQKAKSLLDGEWRTYTSLVPHVLFFYYHSKSQHHIDYLRSHPESVLVSTYPL